MLEPSVKEESVIPIVKGMKSALNIEDDALSRRSSHIASGVNSKLASSRVSFVNKIKIEDFHLEFEE
jgi:hypothetical protein